LLDSLLQEITLLRMLLDCGLEAGFGISRVKKKFSLVIPKSQRGIPETAVLEQLFNRRKSYVAELGGHLLDWDITRFKLQEADGADDTFLPTVSIKGQFTIFSASSGDRLQGTVTAISKTGLIVLSAYQSFLVKVQGSSHSEVNVGDVLEYSYQSTHTEGENGVIHGDNPTIIKRAELNGMNGHETSVDETATDTTPSSSPKKASKSKTPVVVQSLSVAKKRAQPQQTDSPSKRAKTEEPGQEFGNISSIHTPGKSETKKPALTPKTEYPDLPEGWSIRSHKSEKNSWKTFVSPAGRIFKTKKMVFEYIAKGGDGTIKTTTKKASTTKTAASEDILAVCEKVIQSSSQRAKGIVAGTLKTTPTTKKSSTTKTASSKDFLEIFDEIFERVTEPTSQSAKEIVVGKLEAKKKPAASKKSTKKAIPPAVNGNKESAEEKIPDEEEDRVEVDMGDSEENFMLQQSSMLPRSSMLQQSSMLQVSIEQELQNSLVNKHKKKKKKKDKKAGFE